MRRERRRLKAKHLWGGLDPQWNKLRERLFTRHVTNLSWDHLYARLFLTSLAVSNASVKLNTRGNDYHQRVQGKWRQTREWYGQSADAPSPELSNHFLHLDYADATSWEWICWQEKSVAQVWHTKQGVYRRRVRADVRDEPMQVQQ